MSIPHPASALGQASKTFNEYHAEHIAKGGDPKNFSLSVVSMFERFYFEFVEGVFSHKIVKLSHEETKIALNSTADRTALHDILELVPLRKRLLLKREIAKNSEHTLPDKYLQDKDYLAAMRLYNQKKGH